jgi:hypothetical protein
MKTKIFLLLLLTGRLEIGYTQPGNAVMYEIALEYSFLAINSDSLTANYEIVGCQGCRIFENDSLALPSSYESSFSQQYYNPTVKGEDSASMVARYLAKRPLVYQEGLQHVFLPLILNRSNDSSDELIQFKIKIIEKRSRDEMYLFLIGKKEDFFYRSAILELTKLSFAEGVYLYNLNDIESPEIPNKHKASISNKSENFNYPFRSAEISDLKSHATSKRKLKKIVKK